MSQKIAKQLRNDCRRAMQKSRHLKGPKAYSVTVRKAAERLGATEKQARRALRLTAEKLGRAVPEWASRLFCGRLGFRPVEA